MFKFQRIAWNFFKKQKFPTHKNHFAGRLGICGFILIPFAVYMTKDQIWSLSFKMKPEPKPISTDKTFSIPEDVRKNVDKKKMILVIDLDETMVYSRREVLPPHKNYLLVDIKEREQTVLVEIRPYLPQFLEAAAQIFTIYVYTAGTKDYADAVLDAIPNAKYIQKRFYREDCVTMRGNLVKKLAQIKKKQQLGDEKVLVLIDDNKRSISLNKPNSILIHPFQGDQNDEKLVGIFGQLLDFYRNHITPSN